jgi:hypothetical protein
VVFTVLLIASCIIWVSEPSRLLVGEQSQTHSSSRGDSKSQSLSPPPIENTTKHFDLTLIISGVSFLTSIISLVGFILTTILRWRKERREHQLDDVELEKKKLEVEKLRLELRQDKKQVKT